MRGHVPRTVGRNQGVCGFDRQGRIGYGVNARVRPSSREGWARCLPRPGAMPQPVKGWVSPAADRESHFCRGRLSTPSPSA